MSVIGKLSELIFLSDAITFLGGDASITRERLTEQYTPQQLSDARHNLSKYDGAYHNAKAAFDNDNDQEAFDNAMREAHSTYFD